MFKHHAIYGAFENSLCSYKKVLKVMSTSVYTGLNPFNFIRKHFLHLHLEPELIMLELYL
jgi:hypothetical protein